METTNFEIPGKVRLAPGVSGFPRFEVTTALAKAHIYLYGAHITHFQPTGEKPLLFVSKDAVFQSGKAIRGGVPIIFPWFGARASDAKSPAHGFARTQTWEPESVAEAADGAIIITLVLKPNDVTRTAAWADDWLLRFRVTVASSLTMEFEIENHGQTPFRFEDALHTYFNVDDVKTTEVLGLVDAEYFDKTDGMRRKIQESPAINFTGEVDRGYLNTNSTCIITGSGAGRRVFVEKENSNSTVVWNPGSERVKTFADLGNDEWEKFVCVETGNITDNTIELLPGGKHVTKTVLKVHGV